jgi:exopolysaccharide biosynthesis polyprenyl glycosylphosphotransferase
MYPRRFLVIGDLFLFGIAFVIAAALVPKIAPLLFLGGPLPTEGLKRVLSVSIENSILPSPLKLLWILVMMVFTAIPVLTILDAYSGLINQSTKRILASAATAAVFGASMVSLVLFALKNQDYSRLFVFMFAVNSAVYLVGVRLLLRLYSRSRKAAGYYAKNILLIGDCRAVQYLTAFILKNTERTEYNVIGYLEIPCPGTSRGKDGFAGAGLPKFLGPVEMAGQFLITNPISEVIVVLPSCDCTWMARVVKDCDYFGVLLRVVPESLLFGSQINLRTTFVPGVLRLPAVVLSPPHLESDAQHVKRFLDIVVASMLLVLLMPLFLVIIVAIKLTTPRLPAIYRYKQVGLHGVTFTAYKFTTMIQNAELLKPSLMQYNEMKGPVFKLTNDPRVTRLGPFLRKYSLNELPQLWNVVKGDLSLVGPRAALTEELERYELWHKRKLSVRPGLTCLWQVGGRNKISDFDTWVRLDLEYIDNWSLWLDAKIFMLTILVVIKGSGR